MTHWPLWLRYVNKRLVQLQERFIRNQRVVGLPFYLTLESGNHCNLRCPLCATTFREDTLPKGMLSYENAKTIIDRFPALLVVNLSLWGEPFLNKDIFEIIRYARKRRIEVIVQSNFSLPHFNERMAERIVDSDLDSLWLSIDGASQATYEVYRRRGDFALVMRNLELLRAVQVRKQATNPRITWKMVVNKHNEHELDFAKDMAARAGIDFQAVEIYAPKHLEGQWKPGRDIEEANVSTHSDQVEQCYQLWQVMTVNFNGDVFPCCSEWAPEDSLGNVLKQPVGEIWNGSEYRRRRGNNRVGPPRCDDCHKNKMTNYWREWYPSSDADKNSAMLPLIRIGDKNESQAG